VVEVLTPHSSLDRRTGLRVGEWQVTGLGGWSRYQLYYLVLVVTIKPRNSEITRLNGRWNLPATSIRMPTVMGRKKREALLTGPGVRPGYLLSCQDSTRITVQRTKIKTPGGIMDHGRERPVRELRTPTAGDMLCAADARDADSDFIYLTLARRPRHVGGIP
jgi:predicted RNase H-like nuclease (RuvC/YqgF family)